MIMMKSIPVVFSRSRHTARTFGAAGPQVVSGMLNVCMLCTLVAIFPSLLSPSEPGHRLIHETSFELGEARSRAGRDVPDRPTGTGSHVLPGHAGALDDEVEIPDEPEDDEPDDAGFAFPSTNRAFHAIPFITTLDMTRLAVATPSHVHETTPAGSDRRLFLRFCRFLI